jgi:hypothetical protein
VHDRLHRASQRDGVAQRVDGQLRGHPLVDGVADDALGAGVLDRAEVELSLACRVLGDVGQPELVGAFRGEVA